MKRNGFALVLTLMIIVLIAVVIVAFFSSIRTEVKAGSAAGAGQSARELADLALQMVQSQIQAATTQGISNSANQLPTVAWASQPGMIRCYDNSGAPYAWYKLYSAQNMVVQTPSESLSNLTSDLPTSNWSQPASANYGIFTDINSPVICESGTLSYPIVDPSGARSMAVANSGTSAVAGFDISLTNTPGYASGVAASATNNPASMPVRWLYVLRSGTLVPALPGSAPGVVNVPGATTASGSNPIIGRVAFWTDDETCKLNINTAADGTYYDTPRFIGPAPVASPPLVTGSLLAEQQLAITPPVAGEYQRYVGHPAQTRLSTVLPLLASLNSVDRSHVATITSPFMQWGGSQGGTVSIWNSMLTGGVVVPPLSPATRCTPYATVDEWLFGTGLAPVTSGTFRVENALASYLTGTYPGLTSGKSLFDVDGTVAGRNHFMNQLHFFLSASSEAPEVNLFGQPRISIWPISGNYSPGVTAGTGTNYVTTFDRMIANDASLNTNTSVSPAETPSLYYFQRLISTDGTTDYGINRNQQLYGYLETLANNQIPGYGGSFGASKYGMAQMDQNLTEIFDYIRCTNPTDPMLTGTSLSNTYSYAPGRNDVYYRDQYSSDTNGNTGYGQVVPINITGTTGALTKGFGRFDSINEITMDFTRSQNACLTTSTTVIVSGTPTKENILIPDPNNTYVTGLLYVSLFSPSLGPANMYPDIRVEVDGLNKMQVSDDITGASFPVFAAPTAPSTVYSVIPKYGDWHNGNNFPWAWGGASGTRQLTVAKNANLMFTDAANGVPDFSGTTPNLPPLKSSSNNSSDYKFAGLPIEMGVYDTFSMTGAKLDIKIYYSHLPSGTSYAATYAAEGQPGNPADLVQEITVPFPGFSHLRVPLVPNSTSQYSGTAAFTNLDTRLNNSNYGPQQTPADSPIQPGDTARSLVVGYNGDARMIAGQRTISVADPTVVEAPFTQFPGYTSTTPMLQSQHDIYPGGTSVFDFGTFGRSSPGTMNSYPYSVVGVTDTNSLSPGPTVTGDWDNGLSIFPDGPYINKPDEVGLQYYFYTLSSGFGGTADLPYFTGGDSGGSTASVGYSSPNRTIPSPVSFGSLSTGVPVNGGSAVPWRTWLFRPQQGHYGEQSPEDELLLDWFWMPVVEPYAISTPMATAGKVNMNYQIAPFTYITRATALLGVLGSENVIAVPTTAGPSYNYKHNTKNPSYRYPIDLLDTSSPPQLDPNGTMRQFMSKFSAGQLFKSASEICDIYLVPQDKTYAPTGFSSNTAAEAYWAQMGSTGDNSRERPYNGLYPRLTTKSNTYTVHVRAQALAPGGASSPGVWVESPAHVLSEYRGSYVLNRYIDPGDTSHPLPDFATNPNKSLDAYYKYRVLETRRFMP